MVRTCLVVKLTDCMAIPHLSCSCIRKPWGPVQHFISNWLSIQIIDWQTGSKVTYPSSKSPLIIYMLNYVLKFGLCRSHWIGLWYILQMWPCFSKLGKWYHKKRKTQKGKRGRNSYWKVGTTWKIEAHQGNGPDESVFSCLSFSNELLQHENTLITMGPWK